MRERFGAGVRWGGDGEDAGETNTQDRGRLEKRGGREKQGRDEVRRGREKQRGIKAGVETGKRRYSFSLEHLLCARPRARWTPSCPWSSQTQREKWML